MVKQWQKPDQDQPIVRISDPAMEFHEVNLNDLLACCRRELEFRQRVYPKWIDKGTLSEAKAAKELELMRTVCDYFVNAIFRRVTAGARRQKENGDGH